MNRVRHWTGLLVVGVALAVGGCAAHEATPPASTAALGTSERTADPSPTATLGGDSGSRSPATTVPANDPTPPAASTLPAASTSPSGPAGSAEPARGDGSLEAQLQAVLDEWLAVAGPPGAVLGVRLADGTTAVVAAGDRDVGGPESVVPTDRFRIGSITKTFVATVVLQLAEEGALALDDSLAGYVPEAAHADRVTVGQLLDHTSGIFDFAALPEYRTSMIRTPGKVWQPSEIVELVAASELNFEPGRGWGYSNTNYVLLGMIAERATGKPLPEVLRERIFEPLELESTYLEALETAPPVAVNGHYDLDGDGTPDSLGAIPYTALVTSGAAAGGISASAIDVLDFATALFGDELLTAATRQQMRERSPSSPDYGLGLAYLEPGGHPAWGHGGALPGFATLLAHLPDDEMTVVAMANETGVDVHGLVTSAIEVGLASGE